jgi:zinc protease
VLIDPDSVTRHVLPNGLTLLLRVDRSAPVAAVVTHVKAGYFDETDDVVGIAHVLEHMYFKGTPTRAVGEIARETKASGGYLNAHTIYDHTSYFAVLPKDGFARGLDVQADAYANSLIDAAELAKELEVIIQEAKRKADSPGAVTIESLYELLHDQHRIRRWRIGREEGLRRFTREALVAFYRNFYRPANTILAIVGDVDDAATVERVSDRYGSLPGGVPDRTPGPREVSPPSFRFREIAGDIGQTHIAMGWRVPGTLHEDTPALDLFALVLGVGRGSRLYQGVRERQLASRVGAWNYTPAEIGVFGMDAEGSPERAADAAVAMWSELRRAQEEGIRPAEVDRAQRLFEARWLRRLETTEGQATLLAEWEALGSWTLADSYVGRLMTGTAETAVEAARRYLGDEQAAVMVYRPATALPLAASVGEAWALLTARGRATASVRGSVSTAPGAIERATHGAANDSTTPPTSVGPRLERRVGPVHVFRGRSGLPILVRRRPGTPMAHVGVYCGAGTAHEPASIAGVTTIATRAALKGTERRTAGQIAFDTELLGAVISPTATSDGAGWSMSVPGTRLAPAVTLLSDVVQSPVFAAEAMETERTVALANLAELRDDMYRFPLRLATVAAYDGHPYGRGPLGDEESIGAIRAGDARHWHATRILAGPTTVAVVADADENDLAVLIDDAFAGLAYGAVPSLPAPAWPAAVVERVETRERAQTGLAIAFAAPSRLDDRRFAGQMLAGIASGLGGRFFEALREQRSLAYTVQAFPVERVKAGSFMSYIATSPAQEAPARAGLLAEFQRLRDASVTDTELDRARVYALGSHAIAQQSGATVLWEMLDAFVLGSGLEELEEFPARVRRVTVKEIQEFARRYCDPERRVEGIVRGVGNRESGIGNRE